MVNFLQIHSCNIIANDFQRNAFPEYISSSGFFVLERALGAKRYLGNETALDSCKNSLWKPRRPRKIAHGQAGEILLLPLFFLTIL